MIAWIDTETTGLNDQLHQLLEITCVVTDDALNEVARYTAVTNEARRIKDWSQVVPYVLNMHLANGLWGESIALGKPLADVDAELTAFLNQHAVIEEPATAGRPAKRIKPLLGGHTVSFDRGFLEKHLPQVAAALHYRHLDVRSIEELAARAWPSACADAPGGDKKSIHRATADIEHSIAVARYYAGALTTRDAVSREAADWIERAIPTYGGDITQTAEVLRSGAWR